jgi:hypothetical protein
LTQLLRGQLPKPDIPLHAGEVLVLSIPILFVTASKPSARAFVPVGTVS